MRFINHVATPLLLALTLATAQAANVDKQIRECDACHGKDGSSTESEIPTIAGMTSKYLAEALKAFAADKRPCLDTKYPGDPARKPHNMCDEARHLGAGEIDALAAHYASKPFGRAKQAFDAGKAAKGATVHDRYCKKCHEKGGSATSENSGILAGQHMPYLKRTFDEYTTKKRPMTEKMEAKFSKLNDQEKDFLLHYYASQQ